MVFPSPSTSPGLARGWREWAKANRVGVNFTWKAIAESRLKVRRVGKRMLVLDEDGLDFLRRLPSGPPGKPENFKRKGVK
jgi:hypothetical protein